MRGSITFKIVPSYRTQQSPCEVMDSVAFALSSALSLPVSSLCSAVVCLPGLLWPFVVGFDWDSCVTNCLPDGCMLMLFSPKASILLDQKAWLRHYRTPISQPRYRNPSLHITGVEGSLDVQCENVHRQFCSIISQFKNASVLCWLQKYIFHNTPLPYHTTERMLKLKWSDFTWRSFTQ